MIRMTLALVLVALVGQAQSASPLGSPDNEASEHYRELVMFPRLEPSEVAPLILGVLGNTRVQSGWPYSDTKGGTVGAIDATGLRYTITWHNMPGTIIMILSHEPGAESEVLVAVEEHLRAVSDSRFDDNPVSCMRRRGHD